jgi:hypothetical protein
VLLGGDSGKFVFTREKGRRLGRLVDGLATACDGSILLTDSPRTPAAAADACIAELSAPNLVHRCGQATGSNPYQGMLALADAFVVTGESMSMLAESSARQRPLYVFDMGEAHGRPWWRSVHAWRYKPLSHRLAMRFGPARMRRDIGRIQEALVSTGAARWLDEGAVAAVMQTGALPGSATADTARVCRDDLQRARDAVARLFPDAV